MKHILMSHLFSTENAKGNLMLGIGNEAVLVIRVDDAFIIRPTLKANFLE